MRHDHQVFTVFGAFVGERHDAQQPARDVKEHWLGPLVAVLLAALLGATIPALAVTTTNHLRATEAARWKQPSAQPAYFLRVPPNVGFDELLF